MGELNRRARFLWIPTDEAGAQELLERLDRGTESCQTGHHRQRGALVDDGHGGNKGTR